MKRSFAPDLKQILKNAGFFEIKFKKDKSVDEYYKAAMASRSSEIICTKFKTTIRGKDIRTLGEGKWLNDNVISYYLHLLVQDYHCPGNRITFFPPSMYGYLTKAFKQDPHPGKITADLVSDSGEEDTKVKHTEPKDVHKPTSAPREGATVPSAETESKVKEEATLKVSDEKSVMMSSQYVNTCQHMQT